MKPPLACHLWSKPDLRPEDLHGAFEVVETFEDDSHFSRRLVRCRSCGQLYVKEFHEEIDWKGGNDPQYTTLVPVETADEIAAVSATDRFGILDLRPRLQSDFPKEAKTPTVYWVR